MMQDCNGEFTLYVSNLRERQSNTSYPFKAVITCVEDLAKAAEYDHVSALYRDSKTKTGGIIKAHRAKTDFIETDNVIMDCDNKESNPMLPDIPPELWKTPDDVQAAFPGVAFYAIPSRNHMKEKDGLPARPKYHYYFKLKEKIAKADKWAALKAAIQQYFPAFDDGAIDAARFMYGVENPQPVFYDGDLCIDEFMEQRAAETKTQEQTAAKATAQAEKAPKYPATIPVGQRHTILMRFAAAVLKKFGNTDGKAYSAYIEYAAKCEQPFDENEIAGIWRSAEGYYTQNTVKQPGYIAPQEYAAQDFVKSLEPYDYTDIGQATVIAGVYGEKLKFTKATNWLA